jgi:hypothetical protein
VIPATVAGLLAFAAAVGPGYLFVRLTERRRPRRRYTPLEESAEILVVGALATSIGVLAVLALSDVTGLLDTVALTHEASDYLVTHPARVLATGALVGLVSYGSVWAAVSWAYRGSTAEIRQSNAYFSAAEDERPADHGVLATVELRDGRAVTGVLRAFNFYDATREGELLLTAPLDGKIECRALDGSTSAISDGFVVFDLKDVLYLAGQYRPLVPEPTSARKGRAGASGVESSGPPSSPSSR